MLQYVKEKVYDYNYFISSIMDQVRKMMGEEYTVSVYKVTKNNSLVLDSLVILKKEKKFAPNIYLQPYYEAYIQGLSIQELARKLCDTYNNNLVPDINENFSYAYEDIKPFIIYRLVSYERNKKLLEKIPHMKYLDMVITYYCLVREDEEGIGTIRITNAHLQMWETSLQELHTLAVNNTKLIFPAIIKSMDEMLLPMLQEEYMEGKEDLLSDKILDGFLLGDNKTNKYKMYVLSNSKGINGATCLLYQDVLKEFSNEIQSDLFILPSSIHEVILVPFDGTIRMEALSELVKDVNHTQVARDEVLSDRVYFYLRKNNAISM